MKRVVQYAGGALTWLVVAISVVIISGGLLGRPILLAAVPTGSMAPSLRPGDLIAVLPLWRDVPKQGDVVVFRTELDPRWVVHRIIGGSPEAGFITKGDANAVADPNRVFLRQFTGVVPVLQGRLLHFSGLGNLSLGKGPLSNPLVAGLAMAVGVYLLLADAGAGLRALRSLRTLRRRVRRGPIGKDGRSRNILAVYAGLVLAAFFNTLVVAWSLSSVQQMQYHIVDQVPTNVKMAGVVLAGRTKVDRIQVENPALVPIIAAFRSDDPHLRFDPEWAVIGPHQSLAVAASLASDELGAHAARIRRDLYLPLLPSQLLQLLAEVHPLLPAVAISLVPAALVLALAGVDRRARAQWVNLRLQWRVRHS